MPRLDFCSCLVTGRLWGVLAVIALGTMAVCQPTPSSAQPPPSDDEAALEGATTTPKAVKNKPLVPTDAVLFGRWRGKTVCLDLFANGDFELSMIGRRSGKAVAIGRAKHAKKSGPQAIALEVDRIWVSRWVTACRKRNERGRFVDTRRALGVELKAGSPTTVTVRRLPDQKIELCAEACEVLIPDAPLLGGLWRRPKDSPPAKTGDIVRLDLSVGGHGTVVFVVWPTAQWALRHYTTVQNS